MTLLVAVSGGVDSIVMLDKLSRQADCELVVAHFDHGIRPDSAADARFVAAVAESYGLPFVTKREELGLAASEEMARSRRHLFLRQVASQRGAQIATAHHIDDVVETIAINCLRGTGWRGLAVLGENEIARPLIDMSKQEIRDYALAYQLEWVEDETNANDIYLRNRLRRKISARLSEESRSRLVELRKRQWELRVEIEREASRLLKRGDEQPRHFFNQIDDSSADELIRLLLREKNVSLTLPQRQRLLHGIKTARPGSKIEAGSGAIISFSKTTFVVETL